MIKLLKYLKYPIIQAPMLGVTSPKMVSESCKSGILGSLPVGGLSPERTLELIKETKNLILDDKQLFAVNLFAHRLIEPTQIDRDRYLKTRDIINNIALENGFSIENNLSLGVSDQKYYSYHDQIDILLNENIKIISFTFGLLDQATIKKIKSFDNEIILIGTATCMEEINILQDPSNCIDAIVLQGIESGGHRGTFIEGRELPQIPLSQLLNEAVHSNSSSNSKIPFIASGGIYSREMIQYYLSKGASAVQIGTLFIPSHESIAIDAYKDSVVNAPFNDDNETKKIPLTRSYSGRWARGIENEFMRKINNLETTDKNLILPYPIQNYLTQSMRSQSQKSNNSNFTNLWCGFNASKSKKDSMSNIIKNLL